MATPGCIRDLSTIFGMDFQNTFMEQEVQDEINNLIKKHGKQNIGKLTAELYKYLANQGSQWAAVEAAAKKRNLKLQTQRNLENFQWVTETFRGKEHQGIQALLTGSEKQKEGSRVSVDAQQKAFQAYYQDGVIADLEQLGKKHVNLVAAHDPNIDKQIAVAMASLSDKSITFTGDKEILEIAQVLNKWAGIAKDNANTYGAFIGTLPGYIVHQNHNSFMVKKAGEIKWIQDIYDKLNWDKTADGSLAKATEAERKTFLREVYRNIAIGRLAEEGKNPLAHYGSGRIGSVANKMSQGRVLHFESPEAWFDYNTLYGDGNLLSSYMTSLMRMANDTALMKVLGPSPEAGLARLKESVRVAMHKSGNEQGAFKLAQWNRKIDNTFDEVSGKVNVVDNPTVAWVGASLRALQDMIKLGGAVITSFVDIGNVGAEFSYQGYNFLGRTLKTFTDLLSLAGSKEERVRLCSQMGVTIDSYLGDIVARVSGDMAPGKIAEWHRKFFKLNLLTQWTDRCRMSAGMGMAHIAAMERGLEFHQLPVAKQKMLRSFNIKDWEWNELIRKGQVEKLTTGEEFLTPNAVANLSDIEIEKVLIQRGETPDAFRIEAYRKDLEWRYRTYFSDRVRYAVLEPNAGTRAWMRQGTHRGSAEGELLRFIGQFKSFPVAYVRQIMGREFYGRMGEKGWGVSSAASLARMILMMTALGYVSMSAKQMAKGLNPRDPRDPETWLAAMVQGGGAGILGDFMFGKVNRFGGGFYNTLAGPTAGMVNDLYNIYAHARDGEGKAKEILNFAFNNTPYGNVFYIKEPFMYLMGYQLMEAVDKGSWKRRQKRLKEDTAQTYWYGKPFGL